MNFQSGPIRFGTGESDCSTMTRMVIENDGKVGIGTWEPEYQLDVVGGDIRTDSGLRFSYGDEPCDNLIYTSSYGFDFMNFQSGPIRFGTGESDCSTMTRMVIENDGKVGIGTWEPTSILHIKHKTGLSDGLMLQNEYDSDNWRWVVGSSSNTLYLYFNGAQRGMYNPSTGAYTTASDVRRKENIDELESVLDGILKLSPKRYNFKSDDDQKQKYIGFLAQDVEKLFPSLSYYAEEADLYSLDYSGFGILAIKAIQEQQQIIEDQEDRIKKLEEQVEMLLDLLE